MKSLRGGASRLTAEVVIGTNQFGSQVTASVTLDRKDPEVAELLAPLEGLLRRRALSYLSASMTRAEIDEQVRENTRRVLARERRLAKENAEHTVQERVRLLEQQAATADRELTSLRSRLEMSRSENARLRQDLMTARTSQEGT